MAGKERTVIILNIGRITASLEDPLPDATTTDSSSFISKAKTCLFKLLERNIFTKPKDEVAIFLMGTADAKNELFLDHGGYEHISNAVPFVIPTWDLLRVLRSDIQPTEHTSDWLEALEVAIDYIKSKEDKRIASYKIVLITPFLEQVNEMNSFSVISQINELKIDLIVISDELEYHTTPNTKMHFTQSDTKTQTQLHSEQLIERIVSATNGVFSNFADAVVQLSFFPGTKSSSQPWYCPLAIGHDLRIHVAAYLYVTRDPLKSFKTESTDPNSTAVQCTTQYQHRGQLVPNIDLTTTIEGYVYGDRRVAYDQCLNLDYDAGGKSFTCIGFSARRYVLDEYVTGKATYLLLPQSTCTTSVHLLNALGAVLLDADMVMIGRRVRQKGERPKVVALYPMRHPDHQSVYLHMVELIYSENKLEFYFPDLSARKHQPDAEQVAAVDALITAMDLMTSAEGGGEAFAAQRTLNPSKQFLYRAISARALDPSLPLPKFSEDLERMFEMPEGVRERSKEALERVKELFPVVEKEQTKKQRWMKRNILQVDGDEGKRGDNDQGVQPAPRSIVEIGTITPMEDFDLLYRSGEKFSVLCGQLQKVLNELIFNSMSWEYETEKMAKAMQFYREQAKTIGAHYYNDWIVAFKTQLLLRGSEAFFTEVVVKERLGVIGAEESETSVRTAKEVEEFYTCLDLVKRREVVEEEGEQEDDDIFDGM